MTESESVVLPITPRPSADHRRNPARANPEYAVTVGSESLAVTPARVVRHDGDDMLQPCGVEEADLERGPPPLRQVGVELVLVDQPAHVAEDQVVVEALLNGVVEGRVSSSQTVSPATFLAAMA